MLDYWRTEVAFGTAPDAVTPAWRDVTSYVDAAQGVSVTRGRTDQFDAITPSQATHTFDNHDGRFTAELASSPYYPNVVLATRIRHSYRHGAPFVAGNLLTADAASFETSVAAWSPIGTVPPTLTQSAVHAQDGTKAMLVTWGTGGAFPGAITTVTGLVVGRVYVLSGYVYVPSGGSPAVILTVNGITVTPASGVTNAFTRLQVSFTATSTSQDIGIVPNTAATVGQQVWLDAVQLDEGTTAGTFTTSAPPIFYRFDGCVDQWPMQWAPSARYAEAQVSATDRLKRLGSTRILPDIIGSEYGVDSPVAYYNLGDEAGSSAAGNSAITPQPLLAVTQKGTGGTAVFGTATGPGTDGLTALTLTPASVSNGKYLTANMYSQIGGGFAFTMECWFNTSSGTGTGNIYPICSAIDGYGSSFTLDVSGVDGSLIAAARNLDGSLLGSVGSSSAVNDGLTHHAVITVAVSGTTAQVNLYVDGVAQPLVGPTSWTTVFIIGPVVLRLGGGQGAFQLFTGVIAQVAVYSTALSAGRIAQHYLAGSTGFAGERSDVRIARLATYGGINAADVTASENGSSLLGAQDTSGQRALDLIQSASATENGVSFFSGAGRLVAQGRSHRYAPTSKLTLTVGQYESDLQPVLDDFGVQNDVTASRANGATVRVVNQASINAIGVYTGQIDSVANSDADVQDAANWRVQTAGVPLARYPQVTVRMDMLPTAQLLLVLALEIGDRITLTGMPTTGPATSVDLFVEGWTENFSLNAWSMTFNCTRVSGAAGAVWIFDNTASVFDTMRFGY